MKPQTITIAANLDSLGILYEDTHILVCVKPHGTAVQSKRLGTPDMVGILKNHICQNSSSKKEPYLAVIHRLDQPVRGILVFAKTPFAAKELNRQLTHQEFGKYYRALVSGYPPKDKDTLEDYMVKDARTNLSRICSPDTKGAKLARLHYEITPAGQSLFSFNTSIRPHPDAAELDIRLDTGRHHQIRVQLAHMGCPIIGDTKYNPACKDSHAWQEICLCAYRLDFCHPKTRKPLHFCLSDPPDKKADDTQINSNRQLCHPSTGGQ